MIIGRRRDLEGLEKCYKLDEAQFITVFGRSRAGKTFLIREFFKEKACYFFHATGVQNGKMPKQLEKFTRCERESHRVYSLDERELGDAIDNN